MFFENYLSGIPVVATDPKKPVLREGTNIFSYTLFSTLTIAAYIPLRGLCIIF